MYMEKWEIERINSLYKELDKLKEENCRLREQLCTCPDYEQRLTDIEIKMDQINTSVHHIEDMIAEAGQLNKQKTTTGKTTRKTTK